ncbi:unnamed protein product [marine sediment metagenome]|uniref:Addiction module protein n=1 Tax=marine sediment metagenome TaxID=412755 RepID=X1FXC4_9ZZZZ
MSLQAALKEIAKLTPEEKLQLVEEVWDELSEHSEDIPLTEAQKKELNRRLDEYEKNPENVLTWEEVKASIRRR